MNVPEPAPATPIALDFDLPVADGPLSPHSPANITWEQWMYEITARTLHHFATCDPEADARERLADKCHEPFIM